MTYNLENPQKTQILKLDPFTPYKQPINDYQRYINRYTHSESKLYVNENKKKLFCAANQDWSSIKNDKNAVNSYLKKEIQLKIPAFISNNNENGSISRDNKEKNLNNFNNLNQDVLEQSHPHIEEKIKDHRNFNSNTKCLPAYTLQGKLEEFQISETEVKKIKILNFLNFHANLFNIKDEDEKIIFSSKNFITLIMNEENFTSYEKINLYSLLFNRVSEIIYSENKFISNFSNEYENENFILNFFFSLKQKQEIDMVKKNWFSLLIRYLSFLNKTKFFDMNIPQIKNLVHDTLKEIFSKSINMIELFNDNYFHELKISLLIILIEISFLTETIREFSKNYSKERNDLCLKKKEIESRLDSIKGNKKNKEEKLKELVGKFSEIDIMNPKIIHKDSEVIFYKFPFYENLYLYMKKNKSWFKLTLEGERSEDFKAIREYLTSTIYLLKKRINLIDFLKDFNLSSNSNKSNISKIAQFSNLGINFNQKLFHFINHDSSSQEILIFKESEVIFDMDNLKKNFLKTITLIESAYKLINKTWHEESYIVTFQNFLVRSENLSFTDLCKMLTIFVTAVEYSMDISNDSRLSNQTLIKIAEENKDIISYYFNEDNELVNLFYEKRNIKRTAFVGNNPVFKSSYRAELDKIISHTISQHDFNLFLILFKIIVERYSIKKAELLRSQEKKKKISNEKYKKNPNINTESTFDNTSLQTSIISTRKSKLIIDDEDEEFEQAPNLQNIFEQEEEY